LEHGIADDDPTLQAEGCSHHECKDSAHGAIPCDLIDEPPKDVRALPEGAPVAAMNTWDESRRGEQEGGIVPSHRRVPLAISAEPWHHRQSHTFVARHQTRSNGHEPSQAHRQAVTERVKALRAEQRSLRDIAATLNAEGVATFTGQGRWHHGMLPRLLQAIEANDQPHVTTDVC
jgi:hypothetical protein